MSELIDRLVLLKASEINGLGVHEAYKLKEQFQLAEIRKNNALSLFAIIAPENPLAKIEHYANGNARKYVKAIYTSMRFALMFFSDKEHPSEPDLGEDGDLYLKEEHASFYSEYVANEDVIRRNFSSLNAHIELLRGELIADRGSCP